MTKTFNPRNLVLNKEELNAMRGLMLKRAELLTPQDLAYLKKKDWRYSKLIAFPKHKIENSKVSK